MDHSSIETLEPRWSPARLVGGPLPAEFGAILDPLSAGDARFLVPNVEAPLDLTVTPKLSGQMNQIPVPADWEASSAVTKVGAGTLILSGIDYSGTISGGSFSLYGGTLVARSAGNLSSSLVAPTISSGGVLLVSGASGSVISAASAFLGFGAPSTLTVSGELSADVVLQLDQVAPTISNDFVYLFEVNNEIATLPPSIGVVGSLDFVVTYSEQ